MGDGEPSVVHQILLGLKGGEGVAAVAHSMMSDDEAFSWQRKLEKHVRLLPWETETALPRKTLSYYQFGRHAVVLRRWAAGGSLGRSDAHALIGPIDVLTVPVALGLDSGFAWQRAADTDPTPLIADELASLAENTFTELRDQATSKPEILRRTLGKLIDAPAKPLTIIGCPDDHKVALTWALVHIGAGYLTKEHKDKICRKWTFSTYEIADADSIPNIPEILFMPGKPTGRGIARRETVDVRREENITQAASELSELLVQHFTVGESLLPELDGSPSVSGSEIMLPVTGEIERKEQENTSVREASNQSESDHRQSQASSGGYPSGSLQGTGDHSLTSPVPAGHSHVSKRLERDIVGLLRAESEHAFDLQLKVLGWRTAEERAEIRRILGVDDYLRVVDMIIGWCPSIENGLDRFRRFRVATFGGDGRDLSDRDVAAFAVQIVAHPAAPRLFVDGLVQEIDAHGQSDLVDPALAARWRNQDTPTCDLTGASPYGYGPRKLAAAGLLGTVRSTLNQRRWPRAVAVGLVLLAPVGFGLGRYSVDAGTVRASSSSAGSPAAPAMSSDPTGSPPGQDSAKRGIVEVSGGVASNNLVIRGPSQAIQGQPVFLLLQAVNNTTTYPQGECKVVAHEWVCENVLLTQRPASPPGFDIFVVKINPQDRQSYLAAMEKNKELPNPPDPRTVIFKIAGLS